MPRRTSPAPAGARSPTSTPSACSARTCCSPTPCTSTTTSSTSSSRRDVAVAACPWAYLRLGQGVAAAGRHAELLARGGRVALGCDSENAGDAVDVLRAAALAAGLARDARRRPVRRPHRARAGDDPRRRGHRHGPRPRLAGARQAGRRRRPRRRPVRTGRRAPPTPSCNWSGRATGATSATSSPPAASSCATVACTTVDVAALAAEAAARQRHLLAAAGLDRPAARGRPSVSGPTGQLRLRYVALVPTCPC